MDGEGLGRWTGRDKAGVSPVRWVCSVRHVREGATCSGLMRQSPATCGWARAGRGLGRRGGRWREPPAAPNPLPAPCSLSHLCWAPGGGGRRAGSSLRRVLSARVGMRGRTARAGLLESPLPPGSPGSLSPGCWYSPPRWSLHRRTMLTDTRVPGANPPTRLGSSTWAPHARGPICPTGFGELF